MKFSDVSQTDDLIMMRCCVINYTQQHMGTVNAPH